MAKCFGQAGCGNRPKQRVRDVEVMVVCLCWFRCVNG